MSVPDLTVQQSKEKGSALFEKAFYVEREEVWTYWCNPLIEALPVMPSSDQCLKRLVVNLTYNPDHRHLPDHTKMKLLAQLYQLHIPTQNDLDIFVKVEQQLMNRYFACNPISLERRLRYIQEEKKMTVTEYWDALEKVGFDRKIWGLEGMLNELACEYYSLAKHYGQNGEKDFSELYYEKANTIHDILEARGYFKPRKR